MIFRILQTKECKTLYYNGKVDVRKLIISSISFLSSMKIIVEQHGQNARSIINIGNFCRYSTATRVGFFYRLYDCICVIITSRKLNSD